MRTVYLLENNAFGNRNKEKRETFFYAAAFDGWNKNALISRADSFLH